MPGLFPGNCDFFVGGGVSFSLWAFFLASHRRLGWQGGLKYMAASSSGPWGKASFDALSLLHYNSLYQTKLQLKYIAFGIWLCWQGKGWNFFFVSRDKGSTMIPSSPIINKRRSQPYRLLKILYMYNYNWDFFFFIEITPKNTTFRHNMELLKCKLIPRVSLKSVPELLNLYTWNGLNTPPPPLQNNCIDEITITWTINFRSPNIPDA